MRATAATTAASPVHDAADKAPEAAPKNGWIEADGAITIVEIAAAVVGTVAGTVDAVDDSSTTEAEAVVPVEAPMLPADVSSRLVCPLPPDIMIADMLGAFMAVPDVMESMPRPAVMYPVATPLVAAVAIPTMPVDAPAAGDILLVMLADMDAIDTGVCSVLIMMADMLATAADLQRRQ